MVKLSYYLKVSIVIQSSGASPFCHVSYHIFVAKLRKSIRHLRNEKKKTFAKISGTVIRDRRKHWPIADRRNEPKNNCAIAGRISSLVAFSFQKWRICDMFNLSLVQHGIFQEEKVFVAMEECC